MVKYRIYKSRIHAAKAFARLYCRSRAGGWFDTPFRGRPMQGLEDIAKNLEWHSLIEPLQPGATVDTRFMLDIGRCQAELGKWRQ